MTIRTHGFSFLLLLGLAACGTDSASTTVNGGSELECGDGGEATGSGASIDALVRYAPCSVAERVGGFEVSPLAEYTTLQGQVGDGVVPIDVPESLAEEGDCVLLAPPQLFCDPPCAPGTTCAEAGECVPYPGKVSVGTVEVRGLVEDLPLYAREPVWFYMPRGSIPHPAYAPGAAIALQACGADTGAFTLLGYGVEDLVTSVGMVSLRSGTPMALTWQPPQEAGPAKVLIRVEIATHGGSPGRIECHVSDTGSFDVPATLVDALFDRGYSGFPTVTLSRRSADHVNTSLGCIELLVRSQVILDIDIEGLVSCSGDEDCPEGQRCQGDLSCG